MLLPRRMPKKVKCVVYPIVCGIHGFAFGALYAPAQAFVFGMNFEQMLAWIIAGIPFDIVHGVGNLFAGMLVVPLSQLIERLVKKRHN